ncbi:MAG: WD40 repeat domain-containing protein [Tumebacillaceae bacterium]
MNQLRDRIRRIKYCSITKRVIGGDIYGRVHAFDADLRLVASSPASPFHAQVTAMAVGERYIFSRDCHCNLMKWDLNTLELLDVVTGDGVTENQAYEEDDDLNWTASRFLLNQNGRVYSINAFGQYVEFEEETMRVVRLSDLSVGPFLDGICLEHPTKHAISDYSGNLMFGNIDEGDFSKVVKPGKGATHCVRYDKRHDRFWFSTDDSNAIGTTDLDGNNVKLYQFTNDDVEWISFDKEYARAYVSCFDHHVYVFSNLGPEPELVNVIGPFKYQTTNVIHVDDDEIYTSLQSGEIIRFNSLGTVIASTFEDQANSIWQMEELPGDSSTIYCAMEDGSVRIIRYGNGEYGQIDIEETDRLDYQFGRLYRIKPLVDGSFVALTGSGWVFRAKRNGALLWRKHFYGMGKGLDISPDLKKVLFANDQGLLGELDIEDGSILQTKQFPHALWSCGYNCSGRIVVAHRQVFLNILNSDMSDYGMLQVGDGINKRFRRLENGNMLYAGGGTVCELDIDGVEIVREFKGGTKNTVEDCVLLNDFILCITYSSQVTSYCYSEESLVGYSREMPDFPKTMAARVEEDGSALLLIGGRGNYLRAYTVSEEGLTHLVRHKIL